MKMITRMLAAVMALSALVPSGVLAQQAVGKAGVWRLVDAQTILVGRFDLRAYDRPATEQWIKGLVSGTDPKAAAELAADLKQAKPLAMLDAIKAAGVTEIDGVLTLSEIPSSVGWFVIPVPQGADADKIARAFLEAVGDAPKGGADAAQAGQPLVVRGARLSATTLGDVLVIADGDPARFQNFAAADRPDLVAALDAAQGAAVALAVSPNADTRKVIEQMLPQLPPPAGVPSTVLTRGMRTAHVAIGLPPKPSLDLVIQSDNAESAKALGDLAARLLGLAGSNPGFRRDVAGADQLISAVTPRVDGDRLTISLDAAAVDKLSGIFGAGLARGRDNALHVQSISNLKQVGMAVMLYSNEHNGAFPDDLAAIAKYLADSGKQVLTNPMHPDRKPGYTYAKPAATLKDVKNPAGTAIAYETFEQWPPDGIAVLFADGHVEALRGTNAEARFRELMKDKGRTKE